MSNNNILTHALKFRYTRTHDERDRQIEKFRLYTQRLVNGEEEIVWIIAGSHNWVTVLQM